MLDADRGVDCGRLMLALAVYFYWSGQNAENTHKFFFLRGGRAERAAEPFWAFINQPLI